MRIVTTVLYIIALVLIVFNITEIDFDVLFDRKNTTAFITILASLCVVVLLQILRLSKKIDNHIKNKN